MKRRNCRHRCPRQGRQDLAASAAIAAEAAKRSRDLSAKSTLEIGTWIAMTIRQKRQTDSAHGDPPWFTPRVMERRDCKNMILYEIAGALAYSNLLEAPAGF
jgi:hypothetical protein